LERQRKKQEQGAKNLSEIVKKLEESELKIKDHYCAGQRNWLRRRAYETIEGVK